jgi:urease accessory protein
MNMVLQDTEQHNIAQGWLASLDLRFEPRPNKTVLAHRQQRGPLAVQRPFYPEHDVCHLYILHPPGGVAGGDQLTIQSEHKTGSDTVITTPGATKFYRSEQQQAKQTQKLIVEEGASLEWLPQETIYFPGAKAYLSTEIELQGSARLIAWETHCLGLPANQQTFASGEVTICLQLHHDQQPVLLEKMTVTPEQLNKPTGLRNNPVLSTLIATHATQELLDQVREILADSKELISATLLDSYLVVRFLGQSTAISRQLFTQIWTLIRPVVMQREPCPPRIWAT